MRADGLAGATHRRKRRHRPAEAVHDDLVQRRFVADTPDRLWYNDITEHPTDEGKVYCAVVLDVFSRTVVGHAIADHMRAELVVDALETARWRRRPEPGTVVHSDRGAQSVHVLGVRPPAPRRRPARVDGRVASSVDNTMIESFFNTLQRELLDQRPLWATKADLAAAIFEWSKPGTTRAAATPAST